MEKDEKFCEVELSSMSTQSSSSPNSKSSNDGISKESTRTVIPSHSRKRQKVTRSQDPKSKTFHQSLEFWKLQISHNYNAITHVKIWNLFLYSKNFIAKNFEVKKIHSSASQALLVKHRDCGHIMGQSCVEYSVWGQSCGDWSEANYYYA